MASFMHRPSSLPLWLARLLVGTVLVMNVSCALAFIFQPEQYAAGFELSGVAGQTLVRALGILFLMWNVTYPPLLVRPHSHATLFAIVLIQQLIGLAGESWLVLQLPAGHSNLWATGLHFIIFDSIGLAALATAYGLTLSQRVVRPSRASSAPESLA